MKTMHEARSKDELYRKIYHEPEGNIGVLRVKLMHSLFVFLFLSEQTLSSFQSVYFVPSDGSVCGKL